MPSNVPLSDHAQNSAGAVASAIDFNKAHTPVQQIYHGGTIKKGGKTIGRVLTWEATPLTRDVTHRFEVNGATWGVPVDIVPGKTSGYSITMTKNEIWGNELELMLGYSDVWENLTNQNYPFTASEVLFKGTAIYRQWDYYGCWFTEKNPNAWEAEGDGNIMINCGLAYLRRFKTIA